MAQASLVSLLAIVLFYTAALQISRKIVENAVTGSKIKLSPLKLESNHMSVRRNSHEGRFWAKDYLSETGLGRSRVHYPKGAEIYRQGNSCGALFHVLEGTVKLTVVSSMGKTATIALLSEGDFAGEECVAQEQQTMSATATALTDCILLRIAKAEMLRVLRDEPVMAEFFVRYLLRRSRRVQADLVDQLFNSSEMRLARALLLLARFDEARDSEKLVPPVSQEVLAAMIGCTRSRVNFFLNRFRKQGLIDYSDRIRVNRNLIHFLRIQDEGFSPEQLAAGGYSR